jgi:hypothetical protein
VPSDSLRWGLVNRLPGWSLDLSFTMFEGICLSMFLFL